MRTYKVSMILIPVLLVMAAGAWSFSEKDSFAQNYREGEILVKYRSGTGDWERGRVHGLVCATKARRFSNIGIEKLSLGYGVTALEAIDLLSSDPTVEYAELNQIVTYLDMPRVEPGDPAYTSGDQWYLDTALYAGSHVGTTGTVFVDIDIDAPEAWAVIDAVFDTTMKVSVGVMDSGCAEFGTFSLPTGYMPNHEDMTNSVLWTNLYEASDPGVDSSLDPNLFIDDVNGWDFIGDDNNMSDVYDSVAPYHGTHISGIIAGLWDNSVGVAGIGQNRLKVLPMRIIDSADVIEAIDYAIETGGTPQVKVLNASWSFDRSYSWLRDAIIAAETANIAFVAAAGNGGSDYIGDNNDTYLGSEGVYPAQYTKVPLDNLLAVGATDIDGSLAWFSNYGPGSVQIAAPGVGIYSPREGTNGYSFVSGTSFSAPIAASALALVMAAYPALSPAGAIDRVVDGGEFDARLSGLIQSGKRVNLAGALAPFAPYSGLAPMDTLTTISLYADTVSAMYGSISSAISDSPSVAVMETISGGAWAVSPVSPGLATFNIEFDGMAAPVGTYSTGLWRVTGIIPFSASVVTGQTLNFTSLIGGTIDWSVTNPSVGIINSSGRFTALKSGKTRVVLSVDGQNVDSSGIILVNPRVGGGGSGGCGTTSLAPGEPLWPVGLVLLGMILILVRRKSIAPNTKPNAQRRNAGLKFDV